MRKLNVILSLTVLNLFAGCTNQDCLYETVDNTITRSAETAIPRTNPYTLHVVQDAVYSICSEKGIDSIKLAPTDYYVRFSPKDSIEMDSLDVS